MNYAEKWADSSWDFKLENTKTETHCYHNYPAMMIPQIAKRLINTYTSNDSKMLFDPYCGTGTSLVEANLKGINAVGTDLNPLARLISKTKTSKVELQILDLYLKEFNDFAFNINFGLNRFNIVLPNFANMDFWFKKDTIKKLAVIKQFIDNIADEKVKNFFWVAFSETVRESSLTKNNEFKLYRMSEKQRAKFNPDVYGIINSKLARNRKGLVQYLEKTKNIKSETIIYDFNTSEGVFDIEKKSIDIIITSPPYGDSRTTVAYGQFSRLANQWLGVDNASQIDNQLMGGRAKKIEKTGILIVDRTVNSIAEIDEKRGQEVYSFYYDYWKSITNVSSLIKKGKYACYVVGNRRVKGITLPTHEITKVLFEENGFKHKNTFVRNIPNKRMPSENSPTNIVGEKSKTITNEYIVVMQKI
jgi:tRNA G10  N-methylase Trm11